MQKHFLFCLHFVPSLNTWNLNASVRGSSLFCWKILIFPPEAYIIYKTTSAFFTKDGRRSYSLWCLGKRRHKQMLLNYTKWIECEGRRQQSADKSGWRHDSLYYAIVSRCSLSTDVERDRDAAVRQAHLHPHYLHSQQQKTYPLNIHSHQFFTKECLCSFI